MSTPSIEDIARRAAHARREGRLSEARDDAGEALTLCRQAGDQSRLIHVLRMLGEIELERDEREKALQCYEEAVAVCREIDDPLRLAHTVRHLADFHRDEGRLNEAESHYEEALTIYREDSRRSPGDLANAIRGFAVCKDAAERPEEARTLWEEARDLYSTLGVEAGVEECSAQLRV